MTEEPVDSGFTQENIEEAEVLWTNLPTHKNWGNLETHEKALAIAIIQRLKGNAYSIGYGSGYYKGFVDGESKGYEHAREIPDSN